MGPMYTWLRATCQYMFLAYSPERDIRVPDLTSGTSCHTPLSPGGSHGANFLFVTAFGYETRQ